MLIVIIVQVIVLLLFILFLYYLYKPIPLQNLYNKYFFPVSNFTRDENTEIETKIYKGKKFKCYHISNQNANTLIIWFHGGCFIKKEANTTLPFLGLLSENNPNCDILTFEHPTPFNYTLQDLMLFSNDLIRSFLNKHKHKYSNYYVGGDSSGAFFAALTANIESLDNLHNIIPVQKLNIEFNGLITICGFFNTAFNNVLLNNLFNFYIGRSTPNLDGYRTQEVYIPYIAFTSRIDFLYQENVEFAERNIRKGSYLKVFETNTAVHCYISYTQLDETHETVQLIKKFLDTFSNKNVTNH